MFEGKRCRASLKRQLLPIGLGTWQSTSDDNFRTVLRTALDSEYRMIDACSMYANQRIIGEVLREYFTDGKLKREDVFIIGQLPFCAMDPLEAEIAINKELAELDLCYIDLYLIQSIPMKQINGRLVQQNHINHIDTWRVLERFYKLGFIKALGLTNFNARQVEDLYAKAEIKPSNLQVELHLYWPQHELQSLCSRLNMSLTAFAPIGSPGRIILLSHTVQRRISVIPKSMNPSRIVENIDIFDFELSCEDQMKLLSIKKRIRLFEFRFCAENRHFPFDDVALTINQ